MKGVTPRAEGEVEGRLLPAADVCHREQFLRVRRMTEDLAAPLSAEDQTLQSMPDASPTKWHRAHTSWFFETFILKPHLRQYRCFDESYEVLFNSYYNSVGEQFPRAKRGLISRPGAEDVGAYRRHVDEHVLRLLEDGASEAVMALLTLGLHHEQQHQELLLTDIKHALFQNPLLPAYRPSLRPCPSGPALALDYSQHSGGLLSIGHPENGAFAYDNEGPRHRCFLEDFALANRPLNNGEVLSFIEAGGYRNPLLWLSEGWAWVQATRAQRPLYWLHSDGEHREFTLAGAVDLDPARTACHLSYFEADAIARFLGARLPTEAEWEVASETICSNFAVQPASTARFLDHSLSEGLAPHPTTPEADDTLPQMLGAVWQWTQSSYAAYPGYSPPAGAVGEYNGKFMHNQYVLRGGSAATPGGHVRRSYRNFFPSTARWQFSGARLAKQITS